jgi:hypothetical protein
MVLEDDEDSDDVSVDLSGGDTSEGSDDVDTINTFLRFVLCMLTSRFLTVRGRGGGGHKGGAWEGAGGGMVGALGKAWGAHLYLLGNGR